MRRTEYLTIPPLAWLALFGWWVFLFGGTGCAHVDVDRALRNLERGAVAVDILVDQQAEGWAAYVAREVDRCNAESRTPDEYEACMAPTLASGAKLEEALQRLTTAQRALLGLTDAARSAEAVLRDEGL